MHIVMELSSHYVLVLSGAKHHDALIQWYHSQKVLK